MKCPSLLIDCSYIYFHRSDELNSLLKEILLTYSVYKKYCSDYRIYVTYPYRGLATEILENTLRGTRVLVLERSIESVVSQIGSSKPLYLDPYSTRDLRTEELYYFDLLIMGGVVDKPPRKRLTTNLMQMNLPWAESRRISLRGSLVGVSANLNIITEIILRTLIHGDIERAIRETQPKREAMRRAIAEIEKRKKDLGTREAVEDLYKELSTWLNIDIVTFRRALKRAGISRDLWI